MLELGYFRMPLHAQGVAVSRPLDRLGQQIRDRPRRHDGAFAEDVHTLVMVGIHGLHAATGETGRMRAGIDLDIVERRVVESPRAPSMLAEADVRKVLVQCASRGHIENLHAATDTEHGNVPLQRSPGEGQLEGVAPRLGGLGAGIGRRAIRRGHDIYSSDQQQAVDAVKHKSGLFDDVGIRDQPQRYSAGRMDFAKVGCWDDRSFLAPESPTCGFERGAHADDGRRHRTALRRTDMRTSADLIGEFAFYFGQATIDDLDRLLGLASREHERGSQVQYVPHSCDETLLLRAKGHLPDERM